MVGWLIDDLTLLLTLSERERKTERRDLVDFNITPYFKVYYRLVRLSKDKECPAG